MQRLGGIALDRLGVLVAGEGPTTPARAAASLTELARVGVRITNPDAVTDGLAAAVPAVVAHVRSRRGQHGTYAPLFPGFPDQLPPFDDLGLRVAFGWSRLADVENPTEAQIRAAFDFSGLGWWPASSLLQDVPATLSARSRQSTLQSDTRVEWTDVTLVDEAERDDLLRLWMVDAFTAASSLPDDVVDDLRVLAGLLGVSHVDRATVRFRETRTLLDRIVWDTDLQAVPSLGLGPDDLVRLFADLTGSDVSLSAKVTFPRLSRAQRRVVVASLEASPRLADVFRRRGLWLAIARGLHVGEHDAPATQAVLARLRRSTHDSSSVPSQFERLLPTDYAAAVELLGAQAPGLLVRALRRLVALADGVDDRERALTRNLRVAGARVPVRTLLGARAQLADNGATYPRVAFTKRGGALLVDRAVGHLAVTEALQVHVVGVLDDVIAGRLAAKGSWAGERVFVEPGLDQVLVPDALRSTSAGLIQVERGSALPAGDASVLRLFVHWKHLNSDLDLSAIVFDADLTFVGQVSWTQLREGAMVHSGDITSAPEGAQEFIDIDLVATRENAVVDGWRFIAPVVFRYSGVTFDRLEEVAAGWMLRDAVSVTRATFDPATVANAFPLAGRRRSAVPFVLDLLTGQIVYVDVYLSGAPEARTERDATDIGALVGAVVARRTLKTSVAAVVRANVAARGAVLVEDADVATLSVGRGPAFTYDVLRPEKFLADLL